jgi:hypothetical protein
MVFCIQRTRVRRSFSVPKQNKRNQSENCLAWKRKKGDFRLFRTEAKWQKSEAKWSEKKNVEQNDEKNYLKARRKFKAILSDFLFWKL